MNFKSKLLEWSQKEKKHVVYKMVNEKSTGHEKLYHVVVMIDDQEYGKGADFNIKGAEQLASEKTWNMLLEQNLVHTENKADHEKE